MSSASSSQTLITGGGSPSRPRSFSARVLASPWPWRLLVLAVVASVWQVYAITADNLLIPTFTETMAGTAELVTTPETYEAFIASIAALVLGFAISLVLGIFFGHAAARYHQFEGFIDPYLNILLVTPMAALIPILFMSLGLGLESRVLLVVVFSIPVIIVNARAGIRQVDPALIEMATSYGANERQIWRRILLPGALPAIMTGVRLGIGRAVTGMVIVELLMVSVGIGNIILEARGFFRAGELYGAVILVVIEALILVSIVRWVERRLAPWARESALSE